MPENGSINEGTNTTTGTTGRTGTGIGTGTGTGTGTALSQTAQDYGQKISEAATQAKDYVSDKVSVVGDKSKNCRTRISANSPRTRKTMHAKTRSGTSDLSSSGPVLGLILRAGGKPV